MRATQVAAIREMPLQQQPLRSVGRVAAGGCFNHPPHPPHPPLPSHPHPNRFCPGHQARQPICRRSLRLTTNGGSSGRVLARLRFASRRTTKLWSGARPRVAERLPVEFRMQTSPFRTEHRCLQVAGVCGKHGTGEGRRKTVAIGLGVPRLSRFYGAQRGPSSECAVFRVPDAAAVVHLRRISSRRVRPRR